MRAFTTSVIGSFPRPEYLLRAFKEKAPDTEMLVDLATSAVIGEELLTGLDVLTDGEQSRNSFVSFVGQRIPGFEVSHMRELKPEYKEILSELNTQLTYSRAVVTGKIADVDFVTKDVERVRKFYQGPLKFTLPAPYLVMWECWHPEKSKEAYPHAEDFAYDFAKLERKIAEKLVSLGVEFIQLDEPMAGDLTEADEKPDRYHTAFERIYGQKYRGFHEEKKLAFDLINRVTKGLGCRVGMHMDRWPNADTPYPKQGYERLLPELFEADVQQLVLEYSNPLCGSPVALLKEGWPREIGLGCVNVRMETEEDLQIETPEEIVARVEPLVEAGFDPERIWLNPDCGFAPGMYREYPTVVAFAKLRSMVKAAEMLREKYA